MQISLDPGSATHRIVEYGPGFILINEQRVESSLILMPEQLVRDWPPQEFDDLRDAHLETVARLKPELVVLGTGERQRFPDSTVLRPLMETGIGFEVMDTTAACRTYNILMAEGRGVAAALLMIPV